MLRLLHYFRRIISGEGLMRHFLALPDLVCRLTSCMLPCPFESFLIASSGQPQRSFAAQFGAFLRTIKVALVALLAQHQGAVTPSACQDPASKSFAFHLLLGKATGQLHLGYTTLQWHRLPRCLGIRGSVSDPFRFARPISQPETAIAIYRSDIQAAMAANHRSSRRITAGLQRC